MASEQAALIGLYYYDAFGVVPRNGERNDHSHYDVPGLTGAKLHGDRAERFIERILDTPIYVIQDGRVWSTHWLLEGGITLELPCYTTDQDFTWTVIDHDFCTICTGYETPQFGVCQGYLLRLPWKDDRAGSWYRAVRRPPPIDPRTAFE